LEKKQRVRTPRPGFIPMKEKNSGKGPKNGLHFKKKTMYDEQPYSAA